MEFFDQLAYPQSMEHFHLLVFMLGVVSVVYVPYLAYLTGFSVLSYLFARAGEKRSDPVPLELSRVLISAALIDRKLIVYLGLLPSLALFFLVSQLLQSTPALSVQLLAAAFLALAAAAVVLYAYRFSSRLSSLMGSVEHRLGGKRPDAGLEEMVARQRQVYGRRAVSLGLAGAVLLVVCVFFNISALAIASDPSSWSRVGSIFEVLIAPAVWIKFLHFLSIVPAVAGLTLLVLLSYGTAGLGSVGEGAGVLARTTGVRLAATGLLAQPAFVVAEFASIPPDVLSGFSFSLAGAALLAFFLSLHNVYGIHREGVRKHAAAGCAALVTGLAFLMIQDQATIAASTRSHAALLALEYEKATEEFKSSLGISLVTVTGEDIYNGKCSACHLPDARKVGPSFTLAVEKYRGRPEALVAFIRNPVKVDPDYPPMPNQGLKPAEADSVAGFLLRKYLKPPAPSS